MYESLKYLERNTVFTLFWLKLITGNKLASFTGGSPLKMGCNVLICHHLVFRVHRPVYHVQGM